MISYAQNQEDVVLFRLTRLVSRGTYVDVGAAHPILENVTYALYLAGWRGVNIEPMPREASMLKEARPEDETIQAAASDAPGTIKLFEAPLENRGATTFDSATVDRYRAAGQEFAEFEAPVLTIDSVLSKFGPGEVHVLKIDVEGLEKEVLLGSKLPIYQPWVIVMESTKPNSQEDASAEWESIVLDAGYKCVLFDGLNKFYVRSDLPEVQTLLSTPANVFDSWKSYQESSSVEYALSLQETLDSRNIELANAKEYLRSLQDALKAKESEVAALTDANESQRAHTEVLANLNEEQRVYIEALLESIERIKA